MTASSPPALPDANAEVRRLLAAGPRPDGSTVALMRALLAAELVVPMHPEGGLLRMARAHARRPGMEESCLYAFTSHELAARWATGERERTITRMAVVPTIELCKRAIHQRVDAIDIDRGGYGYSMRYRGMVDLLSRTAFDGRRTILLEQVSVLYGLPKTPPPAAMLDEIRALGRAHGLTRLAWCMGWLADAPVEMQLAFSPYPNDEFELAVVDRMNDLTRDRFVVTTHDALANGLAADRLQVLI